MTGMFTPPEKWWSRPDTSIDRARRDIRFTEWFATYVLVLSGGAASLIGNLNSDAEAYRARMACSLGSAELIGLEGEKAFVRLRYATPPPDTPTTIPYQRFLGTGSTHTLLQSIPRTETTHGPGTATVGGNSEELMLQADNLGTEDRIHAFGIGWEMKGGRSSSVVGVESAQTPFTTFLFCGTVVLQRQEGSIAVAVQ